MKLKVVRLSCLNPFLVESSYCCYLLAHGARNLRELSRQDEGHLSSLRYLNQNWSVEQIMNSASAIFALAANLVAPKLTAVQFVPWRADSLIPITPERIRRRQNICLLFEQRSSEIYRMLTSASLPADFNANEVRFRAAFGKEEFLVDRYGVVSQKGTSKVLSIKQFHELRVTLEIDTPMTAAGQPHEHLNKRLFWNLRFR